MSGISDLQQLTAASQASLSEPPSAPKNTLSPPDSSIHDTSSSSESASERLMGSFKEVLTEQLNNLDAQQKEAHQKLKKFAAGEIDDVHDVTISMQKANLSLEMATLVRNKFLGAIDDLQQLR